MMPSVLSYGTEPMWFPAKLDVSAFLLPVPPPHLETLSTNHFTCICVSEFVSACSHPPIKDIPSTFRPQHVTHELVLAPGHSDTFNIWLSIKLSLVEQLSALVDFILKLHQCCVPSPLSLSREQPSLLLPKSLSWWLFSMELHSSWCYWVSQEYF